MAEQQAPTLAEGMASASHVEFARLAETVPTPALLYRADEVIEMVARLRDDLAVVPGAEISFAIKANRFPPLLRLLASHGVGADVASMPELGAAAAARFSTIYATGPSFSGADLVDAADRGVLVDIDSVSQLKSFVAAGGIGREIGLRIRTPISPADRDNDGSRWSRFGVDPADPELHSILRSAHVRVTRLHAHTGELVTASRVDSLVGALLSCADVFDDVELVNIGGGLTLLYAHAVDVRQAWINAGSRLADYARSRGRNLRLVVEPGMLLTALAGYLIVSVTGTQHLPDGRRIVTVDASGWSLLSWSSPRIRFALPQRAGEMTAHDVAGESCYENDYLVRDARIAAPCVGDRLVLTATGAYVASMARGMHGIGAPGEWLVE
ncbi:diaminopimelate decarboxylase family protein [Nocardia gipuzkoensis]